MSAIIVVYIYSTHFLIRFLRTPERLRALRKAKRILTNRDRRLARMKKRLEFLTSVSGLQVENDVQVEIEAVVEKYSPEMDTLPGSDFRHMFWNQQV